MASKKKADVEKNVERKAQKEEKKPGHRLRKVGGVVFIIVLVLIIGYALLYTTNPSSQQQVSISVFEGNFNNAPKVGVVVSAYNGTGLASATTCATNLIEQLTYTHGSAHKNASMIGFFVINSTNCVYSSQLGSTLNNYVNATPSSCLSMAGSMPSIFINYSDVNSTRITPGALYVSGTSQFLAQCGVASEITTT